MGAWAKKTLGHEEHEAHLAMPLNMFGYEASVLHIAHYPELVENIKPGKVVLNCVINNNYCCYSIQSFEIG